MKRKEALSARLEKRKEGTLFAEDYLLGVHDAQRMGALRFKLSEEGPFLQDGETLAAPPWASLRDLEFASLQLEKESLPDKDSLKWLNILLALSLIHISEPTRRTPISYAVFCLKKK